MKIISELLARLGTNALSDHLGHERTERLQRLGQDINATMLAEILILENGINVFRSKSLRLDLLITADMDSLQDLIGHGGTKTEKLEKLEKYNNFSWGYNEKSKKYLEFFGLSSSLLVNEVIKLEPISDITVKNPLYSYQNWIRKRALQFLQSKDNSRVIIHMPTGSGKTRTTLEAVCDFIRSSQERDIVIVWFAHSEELCDQAASSFSALWTSIGSEKAQIIRLWGGAKIKEIVIDKPTFVVTSFQTAYKMLSTTDDARFSVYSEIKNHCKLLIVDEAHQSIAPTYSQAIELFSGRDSKIIGLTATPGRHHINADVQSSVDLSVFYQNNKIDIVDDNGLHLEDPITYLTDKMILSAVTRRQLDSGSKIKLTNFELKHIEQMLDVPKSVLDKLGNDEQRTGIIASHAIKLAVVGRLPTIIFAPSKQNAVELASLISLRGGKAVAITGETHSVDRAEAINNFKNGNISVLVNFGVLTTGFDAPNIKAVIVARPTASVVLYSQMIGRGLRGPLMGGTSDCLIVDVIDNIVNMPDASKAFQYFDTFYNE